MDRIEPTKNELSMYIEIEEALGKVIRKYKAIERESGEHIAGLVPIEDIQCVFKTKLPSLVVLFGNHTLDFPNSFEHYFDIIKKYV